MKTVFDIKKSLEKTIVPDVYKIEHDFDFDTLKGLAEERGFHLFRIKGKSISDEKSFLENIGGIMKFPDYYGMNWDALEECIRDLEWIGKSRGYIIAYEDYEVLSKSDPKSFGIVLSIFQRAVDYWNNRNIPMYIFLGNS